MPTYPAEITAQLIEIGGPFFKESVTVLFKRYGRLTGRNFYIFSKSYLGPVDDTSLMWWSQGDDVIWSTPFKVLSLDLVQMKIYGGDDAGLGQEIGRVIYQEKKFYLDFATEMVGDAEKQQISIRMINTPAAPVSACPSAARLSGLCELYTGINGAIMAIDFRAIGEIGPQVAKDVASVSTVLNLARSIWNFKPDVEQVRSKYLIPMLKAIGQMKALRKSPREPRDEYLKRAQSAYSNMIITSLDVNFKTQKMMPEALVSTGKLAIGSFLAYLGLNGPADRLISSNQPPWFKELIAPIIREMGAASLDLLLNGNNTPYEVRMNRILAMEVQIKNAVRRLCQASPTAAQSECTAALNQP